MLAYPNGDAEVESNIVPFAIDFGETCAQFSSGRIKKKSSKSDIHFFKMRLSSWFTINCDAPEKRQAFGNRSKQAMSGLVFGKEIELRPHSIDRYGRTVAQVVVNGEDVGVAMLRLGMVWVYDRYITEASAETKGRYQTARDEAKKARLGLWSDPNSVPPWIFRHLAKGDQDRAAASKWIEATAGSNPPSSELVSPVVSQAPSSPGEVWVNTKSGKYWKLGSLFYGKTKRGEYMTEDLAIRGGYRPANGSGE